MKLAFCIINGPNLSWVSGCLQNFRMPSPLSCPVSRLDCLAVGSVCACAQVCTCAHACDVSLAPSDCDFLVCKQGLAHGRGMRGNVVTRLAAGSESVRLPHTTALGEKEQEPPHLATWSGSA